MLIEFKNSSTTQPSRLLAVTIVTVITTLLFDPSLGLANAARATGTHFTDVHSQFSTANHFDRHHTTFLNLTRWVEWLMNLGITPSFEQTNTDGIVFFMTTMRFQKNIQALEHERLSEASAQQILFPKIRYHHCTENFCEADQEIGPLIPNAHYRTYYQLIKINNQQELDSSKLPQEVLKHKSYFPKYVILQLATDWSQYCHRASSVSVFEPTDNEGWIQVTAYQTLTLTNLGALGKPIIQTALTSQLEGFIWAFAKL